MTRYRIEGVFAEGAQGRIHKAFDILTARKCVLKTGLSVREEAFLALELNHPYIAKPFDFGVHPEFGDYAAFPEFSEPTLREWKPKHQNDLRRVALQIVEFLAYLHHRGWLYHDFKPEHFLVSDQQIYVLDLGLCRKIQDHSHTFSGTFPFIAPERLSGRRGDPRSDLFALGMMLLSVLLPEEEWDYEPSLPLLQELPKRATRLSRFWRDLISEMTAQEPSQRCESAQEVWKKLLPENVRRNELFFPIRGYLSEGNQFIEEGQIVAVRSSSLIHLSEVGNQALLAAWKKGLKSMAIDFREKGVEDSLDLLHRILLGQPSKDFFSCVNNLQTVEESKEIFLLFRGQEWLTSQKRALFAYAISALIKSHFKILVITSKALPDLSEESCKLVELPLMSREETERILGLIFPSNDNPGSRIAKDLSKDSFSVPEQIVNELRKTLSKRYFSFWPAGAKESFVPGTLARLSPRKLTILAYLAISGTSLSADVLAGLILLPQNVCEKILTGLQEQGFVQWQRSEFFLTLSEREVLNRLKQEQIVGIAEKLLEAKFGTQNPEMLFRLALFAKKDRLAAITAIRIARNARAENRREASYEWYWKAFSSGAALPKSLLFRLAKFCMFRAEISKTRQILKHIRKEFGLSYRLLNRVMDSLQRSFDLEKGERLATWIVGVAKGKKLKKAEAYFTTWLGAFQVRHGLFDQGEKTLNSIHTNTSFKNLSPGTKGLIYHSLGLSNFYRGNSSHSISYTRTAYRLPHYMRINSLMNLGLFLGKSGKAREGEHYLQQAIDIFRARNDTANLAHCYANLGVLFKQRGLLKEASQAYHASLQLALANRNNHIAITISINLGNLYQLEGRSSKAIRSFKRAIVLATRIGQDGYLASIYPFLGQQYAVVGKTRLAIRNLKKALLILKKLDFRYYVTYAYENLGFSYMVSKQFQKAELSLKKALAMTVESKAIQDSKRIRLLIAVSCGERRDFKGMKQWLHSTSGHQKNTFEAGLNKYVNALLLIRLNKEYSQECRQSLHEAQRIFNALPSLFWLGKVYKLKAEYYLRTDHYEKAHLSLQSAHSIFSRIGAKNELIEISKGMVTMKNSEELIHRMAEKLPYKILLMIQDVLAERDPDKMIEEILHTTLQFTDMQRAVLILDEDPPRIFKSASIEETAVQEIREISHSAMNSAIEKRKSFVCLDVTTNQALRNRPSIVGNRILSVLCFPLKAEDQLIGVLYLDSREGVETISQSETSLLEIFASIISVVLLNLLALEQSIKENKQLRSSLAADQQFPEILGNSEETRGVRDMVYKLLNHELPVLISGETGTGKELVARVLHSWSKRKESPFVAINCSAISKTLLENELFGHEKGSFTGANHLKLGLFEDAGAGTVFLDEIGDMPLSMQSKLLRVLQEGEFRRVGGNKVLRSNARIVLATNKNLLAQVRKGKFREDLYYRICGVQIELPSLRNRSQDIPLLGRQFLKEALLGSSKRIHGFTPQARELMLKYSWPGNVRQLKNEVERIAALTEKEWIDPEDFSPEIQENLINPKILSEKGNSTLKEIEKKIIEKRLDAHKWNIVRTARSLGLTRHGLYSKMKIFGISKKETRRTKGPARSGNLSSLRQKKRA